MKATPIPQESRAIVARRSLGRCERCGGPGHDCHHRRSRRVRDRHVHCPCNLILLCRTCHRWAHGNPVEARTDGLVVATFVAVPYMVPRWVQPDRWVHTLCDGSQHYVGSWTEVVPSE